MTFVTTHDRFGLEAAKPVERLDQLQLMSSYKLVETFSALAGRSLKLIDGPHPCTVGNDIFVPLAHPAAYQLVSHELAHVLFGSNPYAESIFLDEYVKSVARAISSLEVLFEAKQEEELRGLLKGVMDVLECHRVDTLWGELYGGSYTFGRELAREQAGEKLVTAHANFADFLAVLEAGLELPLGRFDKFSACCAEALAKVEHRGPAATLMVGKWLITQLVNEMLGDLEPSDKDAGSGDRELSDEENLGLEDESDNLEDGSGDSNDLTLTGSGIDGEAMGADLPISLPEGMKFDPKGAKDEGGNTRDVDGTAEGSEESKSKNAANATQRAAALKALLDTTRLPQSVHKQPDKAAPEAPSPSRDSARAAAALASAALHANVGNEESLETSLTETQQAMQHRIDEVKKCAEQHSRISLDGDTNLRRDIPAKVVFSDIREEDIEGVVPDPLTVEDNLTVKKLRSMFSRVMGRKRVGLDHVGSVIDVQAAITRRVTGLPTPIFQQEIRGQGFRALLLIDRSSSMRGTKHQQSEKAVRIAARALRYPFVHFDVWGFQSLGPGRVDISRFDPTLDVFTTSKSEIGGVTPLHLAIRCATRYLADSGPGSKHMFVITDGMPAFTTAEGQKTTPRDALIHARDEVRDARKRGLSVTGAVIGEILDSALIYALGPRELGFMFGPKKYWAQINPESIGSGMVDLVSTSFVEYLQGK